MRRKRKANNTPTGYLSTGKFQKILEEKYGLKIGKEELIHALASPSDTQIVLQVVPLPKQQLVHKAKPKPKKQGRHSYLHKQRIAASRRGAKQKGPITDPFCFG